MTTENIVITIREDGSREVARNIRDVGSQSASAQRSVNMLKSALIGLGGALALNQLKEYADIWTQVQGKVNIFTHSAQETAQVMERLYKIAQDTRQPIDGVGNSFHQLSIAGAALGASQEQLLTFTQAIGNALAVQGTSANTARGGILQLGQAMNEGIVRAQEYNSMINAMPIVLKTVANNLEGVDGSLAKLRKRMLDGKLYSKDFFDALLKGAPQLSALFERSGKTIDQSLTIVQNALTKYVGELNAATGAGQTFYEVARFIADNMDDLARGLIIVASPFILQGLVAVGAALRNMAIYAAANPYVALAAAITMVATALALYRNEIILVEKDQVSLGDYMNATWELAGEKISELSTWIGDTLPGAIEKAMGNIVGFQVSFEGADAAIRPIVNGWIGWFVSLPKLFLAAWEVIPDALYNIFATAFNSIKALVANGINGITSLINPLLEKANIGGIMEVQFEETKPRITKSWEELAADMSNIIKEGVGTDYIKMAEDGLDSLTKRATKFAKERQAANALANQPVDLSGALGGGEDFAGSTKGADKAAKELLKLEKQLANVVSAASPAEGAMLKLNFAESILEKSLSKGLLTREQYNKYLALTREHYAEIADPLGELNKRLDEEQRLLQMNSRAREVEAQALAARRQLMAKGVNVDEKELQTLRDRYTGLQKLSEQIRAQDALLADSVEKRRAFVTQLQAIKKLLDDPNSGFTGADAQEALYQTNPQLFAGTDQYVNHVKKQYQDMFDQIRMMREQDVISAEQANQMMLGQTELLKQAIINAEIEAANARLAMNQGEWADIMLSSMGRVLEGFTSLQAGISDSFGQLFTTLTDGFANSFASAIVKAEDLGEALRNVASQAVEQLIASLIKLGIQWAIQAALSQSLGASTTAASVAMGATVATAWAPAAAMVSLASWGSNSIAAMAGIGSTVALTEGLALSGMAHDGMDNIPKEGTWLLDKGERVVDSRTNADLKAFLAGAGNYGQGPVATTSTGIQLKLIINNNYSEGVSVSAEEGEDEDGNPQLELYIDRIEESLAGRMGSGRGPLNRATGEAFGLAPRARGRG